MLDYDGTLAGFRVNRFTARPWAGVPKLIREIQREGGTRIAVVTGRPAAEIPAMLELETPVEVWGLHGAERLYPDGRREFEETPSLVRARLDEVRERLRRDAFGGLFEDKPNAAVMHWRGCSTQQARLIERKTRALFEPLAEVDGLALLEFEAGIELARRPRQGWRGRGDPYGRGTREAGELSRRRPHGRMRISRGQQCRGAAPKRADAAREAPEFGGSLAAAAGGT